MAYLAGNGKIRVGDYEKISQGKGEINETELAQAETGENPGKLLYRGKEFEFENDIL